MPSFEKRFNLFSYAAVFCGFFALWVSATFGTFEVGLFLGVMLLAWNLENTRWQINERLGTALVVFALPAYYLLFRFRPFYFSGPPETMLPGLLARLILTLTAIKLLQRKSDRDWVFLYLMSFFELLLAAGLSISVGYVIAFAAYIFSITCTIILFEIRKTDRQTRQKLSEVQQSKVGRLTTIPVRRIVATSAALILLVALVAVPMASKFLDAVHTPPILTDG